MIRINKNIGQKKFFHLGHFIYLIIYIYIYIYIYPYIFFKGGRSIRIFQSQGGEGNKWTLIRMP